jgi:restriction system protein
VDITAQGPHGELVAAQCKRYNAKKKGSSDEMQKFIGMIYLHHHADKGMYFTTSSYTKDARKLGEDNHIELIDGQDLIKIIRNL